MTRVFALPPGADFTRALVAGLAARFQDQPPEALARVEIWVNTQRMRRALIDRLIEGAARLLPRVRVLTDLAPPPSTSDLRRKLELSRLVSALLAAEPGLAAGTAAFDLADSLQDLLDEMQGEGIPVSDFSRIDAAEHAAHWQRSLRFLEILASYPMTTGQGRLRATVDALAARWAIDPPPHPVLVAGSTGSRGATRAFMAAVTRLPQGALILPGFDDTLPARVWDRLGRDDTGAADHPQYGFRRLAEALGFDPAEVRPWVPVEPPCPPRNALVSLALRPAPVTDQWRIEGAAMKPDLDAALQSVTWIEAPDPRAEALALAHALREAAETGAQAALVTPDRVLARRVSVELDRWGMIPDDSAGRPLALTPPGVLLRRLADLAGAPIAADALLSLLKHPLTNSAADARTPHLALTSRLELDHLRGGAPHVDFDHFSDWARKNQAEPWIDWLRATLTPLVTTRSLSLTDFTALHFAAAEALAAGPSRGEHRLWDKEAGQQALALMQSLTADAEVYGTVSPAEYRALLASLMASRAVPEEAVVTHGSIAIWGTLEARVQSADLVILGGLNEGIWPRLPTPDPWLSRAMRRSIDLPSPEGRIGLSAHDFQQAMGAHRVILSRAARDADAPTVAARWLSRLENLLLGLGPEGPAALAAAKARGERLWKTAAWLDRPEQRIPPAPRPAPRPPRAASPAELSVTQIETLIRDPYDIYARKILNLRPLDPPGRQPDALERGSALHAVMEDFLNQGVLDAPTFRAAAARVLAREAPWPAVRVIWTARLMRRIDWILAGEAERRTRADPAAQEVRGRRILHGLPAPFAVTAKADRIDRAVDGLYAIYDYKSGGLPSEKQAAAFHLQLPLEAAIAETGGFAGLPAASAFHLELIGLGTGKTLRIESDPVAIAQTLARLVDLIRRYQTGALGYVARLRPERLTFVSDYDHLSRHGEWSDGQTPEVAGW